MTYNLGRGLEMNSRGGDRVWRVARACGLLAFSAVVGCAETVSAPTVTAASAAGRYNLESVGGKTLPALGPALFLGFTLIPPNLVTGGFIELGAPTAGSWHAEISERSQTAPFTELSYQRTGTMTVDSNGDVALQQNGPGSPPSFPWSGKLEGSVLTVDFFAKYGFRKVP